MHYTTLARVCFSHWGVSALRAASAVSLSLSHLHIGWKWGFPSGPVVKNLPANAGDAGDMVSIPGSGQSPALGNGNPFLHSCLENSVDRGAWQATGHEVAKSQIQLSTHTRVLEKYAVNAFLKECMN